MPFNQDKCHALHVSTANQAKKLFSLFRQPRGCHQGGPQELCALHSSRVKGAKDPWLYQAGFSQPEQLGGACPV